MLTETHRDRDRGLGRALPQIRAARAELRIVGTAPLIVCSWMTRITRAGLPEAEQSELARYRLSDGSDAIPYAMFRQAVDRAARNQDESAGGIFLGDEKTLFAPLTFKRESLTEMTAQRRGKTVPLVRVVYHDWSLILPVEYQEALWSTGSLLALLRQTGTQVGIGQMRPEHGGENGTFVVEI